MIVDAIHTRRFTIGEDIVSFVQEHLPHIEEGSILVITSKIISLAEKRVVDDVWEEREDLVLSESTWSIKDEWGYVSYRDGMLVGSAGMDRSNGFGKVLLLPRDCYRLAKELHTQLTQHYNLKQFGLIITDSRSIPLRYGAFGMSLGHFGFEGVRNYVGTQDLDGRTIAFEKSNIVDALAVSAVLQMGETDECRPLCVIRNAYVTFTYEDVDTRTIIVPFEKDRFFRILDKIQEKIKGGL